MLLSLLSTYVYANGTTVLPLANISTPFSVYQNDSHLIFKMSEEVISIYTHDAYYYYHIENEKQSCYKQQPEEFPPFFPDLDNFQLIETNYNLNGTFVSVYRRQNTTDKSTSEFFSYYASEELFYCIQLNDGYCLPVSYETHGRNPVLNSHTDIYIYNFNEIDTAPDYYQFELPKECENIEFTSKRNDSWVDEISTLMTSKASSYPKNLDWRVRGYATPVVDQASCGSCWAFSVAGMLEGRINAKRSYQEKKVTVSAEEILDCLWTYDNPNDMDNAGCNGGYTMTAMNTMMEKYKGKVPFDHDSPYVGFEQKCNDKLWNSDTLITKTYQLEKTDEAMYKALQDGPIACSIAVASSMSYYTGGIYDDPACGYGEKAALSHAVVIIGYGVDEEKGDYIIIKNSWSNNWGVDGYIYLKAGKDLCGYRQRMVVAEITGGTPAHKTNLTALWITLVILATVAIAGGLAYYFYGRYKKEHEVEALIDGDGAPNAL